MFRLPKATLASVSSEMDRNGGFTAAWPRRKLERRGNAGVSVYAAQSRLDLSSARVEARIVDETLYNSMDLLHSAWFQIVGKICVGATAR